jgi:hypothetical protein
MPTDTMENVFMSSLELFVAEVEKYDNLEIVAEVEGGGCNGSDIIVIENSDVSEEVEGHQITVELPEIFAKCYNAKTVERFLQVVNCEENPIKCFGVTRIVGYYSRVQNWNKSKIGELRDRQEGQYGTGKHNVKYKQEALATVDAL